MRFMARSLLLALSLAAAALLTTACIDLDALFAECEGDSDCDDDEECNDGACEELECTEDSDCDPGEECRSDECKRIPCTTDEECGEGAFCDLVDGKCDEIPSGEGEGEGEGGEGEGEEGEGEGEGGEGEGEGEGCNGVSAEGDCNGDLVERCVDGSFVETFDCNSSPFPSGQTDCQFISAVDRVDCAVQAGAQCILDGTQRALCQGSSGGCRLDDTTSGTCVSSAALCSSSDEFQCIGERFIVNCLDEAGFGSGQPLYVDCAFSGGNCVDNVGCLVAPGDFCVPDLTQCGASEFDVTACPVNGVCPDGGGTGSITHSTGLGETFSNDTPINTSSQQGAIDACNAHFDTTTCGVPCPGSNCTDVTRDSTCTCTPPGGVVWHFGQSACFTSSDAPGVVSTIDSSCTQTSNSSWN